MKKIILVILFSFTVCVITVGIVYQVKVECFKLDLNKDYSLFSERKRISYSPFLLFYLQSKIFNKHYIYWDTIHQPYLKNKIKGEYIFNFEYNAYLMYCYYEKDKLRESLPPPSRPRL